jgi:hypothetical protein
VTGIGYAYLICMGRSIGELSPMLVGVAKGAALGALALVLTLDVPVQEFAELISLSNDARRERFHLPPACTPIIGAVKPAAANSSRLNVFVDCSAVTTAPSSPIEPASLRDR